MSESNCTVVREVVLDKDVTVESAHLRDSEYADAAKGSCSYRKDLTLCNISPELSVSCRLKSEECDVAGNDIALECTLCNFLGKCSSHDELILHGACRKLLGACVTTVEAHERICVLVVELALDGLLVHVVRYRVVDIEKCNDILGYAVAEILGKTSVDIYLTGYGDTHTGKT